MLVRTKAKILLKKKMLRIIFYLIFLIILSNGLTCFGDDKAEDELVTPIGDIFHINMKNIKANYKDNKKK